MNTNFDFLKKIDQDLFDIITEAEKLYRDEYFEQCMTQTRRFGEHVCKNVLIKDRLTTGSFDDMLATLKDKAQSFQEKEFVDDLYFLKRQGNNSVHSGIVKRDGMTALECLQRAFEVAINYAIHSNKASKTILKRRYDTELLITGEKSKSNLTDKYLEEKSKTSAGKKKTSKTQTAVKQSYNMKSSGENKSQVFKILLIASSIISATIMLMLLIL